MEAMKRVRVADVGPRDIVRLNVGGTLFQTSRETLSRSSGFFASLLDFDGEGDRDADGNLFVDRNGMLFDILLQSWRTSRRPPQRLVSLYKAELLEEAKFYVADEAAARISGRTCESDLSPSCRRIALDEAEGIVSLVNVFEASLKRKDVADLQLPPLLLAQARSDPVLAGDFPHCKATLNAQMGGVLPRLLEDPLISKYVVVAGGAVVGALTGCAAGDVDFFLVGVPAGDGEAVLSQIYSTIMKSCQEHRGDAARLLVTRSASAVTIFEQQGSPVQIVLSTYSKLEDLLVSFDIDCACCAFVLSTAGGSFVCTPRCRRSLEYHVNLMESHRHSAAYVHRLEKYATRGFAIGLPGLDLSLVSSRLLSASYIRMKKNRDLLLRVLPSPSDSDAPGISCVSMHAGNKTTEVRCRKQKAKKVSGLQRLLVLSFARHIREVESPFVARSSASSTVVEAHNTEEGVLLLRCEEQHEEFWLLWGVATHSDDDSDEEDSGDVEEDGVYSITPLAKAVILFESCLKSQNSRLACEEPLRRQDDDDWCHGGVMFRLSKHMRSDANSAKSMADVRVYGQLSRREKAFLFVLMLRVNRTTVPCVLIKVSFVYDFVNAAQPFESLTYVRNAEKRPLAKTSSEEEFVRLYGLNRRLTFKAAVARPVLDHDWWSEIYDGP